MAIEVVIADDHPVAREGLKAVLSGAGIAVIGEAADGREALRLLRELRPDVGVVDVALPGLSGVEVARRAVALGVPVVLISMYGEPVILEEAMASGAVAYVPKGDDPRKLIEAVEAAARVGSPPRRPAPRRLLTPRELEVVQLICEGRKLSEIAQLLHRALATVRAHKASAMRKLGVHTTPELMRRARELGLVRTGPLEVDHDGA